MQVLVGLAGALAADADSAEDIPGVVLAGIVLGGLLLIIAIRGMFGRKK